MPEGNHTPATHWVWQVRAALAEAERQAARESIPAPVAGAGNDEKRNGVSYLGNDPPAPRGAGDDLAAWFEENARRHPIEALYRAVPGPARAVAMHVLACLADGAIVPDDLADWLDRYHQGANRVLLEEWPVTAQGLDLLNAGGDDR
jgi:hypothetical protein